MKFAEIKKRTNTLLKNTGFPGRNNICRAFYLLSFLVCATQMQFLPYNNVQYVL